MAAPMATASSGLTALEGVRPKMSLHVSCTLGILRKMSYSNDILFQIWLLISILWSQKRLSHLNDHGVSLCVHFIMLK